MLDIDPEAMSELLMYTYKLNDLKSKSLRHLNGNVVCDEDFHRMKQEGWRIDSRLTTFTRVVWIREVDVPWSFVWESIHPNVFIKF